MKMTPQQLVAWYQKGVITGHEAVNRLVKLVIDQAPAGFAVELPAEWLADIREQSADIPNPDEMLLVESVCNDESWTPEKHAARQRAEKERYVAGLRVWKAYFDAQSSQG